MISFVRSILISIADLFMDIASALKSIKGKDDEPNYLGGGASTEIPQSFHVDRNQESPKKKRGRPPKKKG